jgi:hypothetical protein
MQSPGKPKASNTTFVSIMSDNDVPIETIACLVGHKAEGYLQFARQGQSQRC